MSNKKSWLGHKTSFTFLG